MSKVKEIIKTAIALSMQNADINDIYKILDELDEVKIKIWREDETVKLPKYAHDNDACMDIFAWKIEKDIEKHRWIIHTGLHFELPEDYEMEIRPKSRNTKYRVVSTNSPSTIDEGYRGEVLIIYTTLDINDNDFPYKEGDGVAQLLVRRREKIIFNEVNTIEELGKTSRGNGGFGSTGN